MPDIEDYERNEYAILWPFESYDDQGESVVGEPIQLKVRWEETRRDMAGPASQAITTVANVVVDRVIPLHSHMWLGTLGDWYRTGSSGDNIGLMEVVSRENIPDVKGRSRLKVVGLNRLYDK